MKSPIARLIDDGGDSNCVVALGQTADSKSISMGEDVTLPCEKLRIVSCGAAAMAKVSNKLHRHFVPVGQRYPVEILEESMGEGINGRSSGHADFKFDAGGRCPSCVYMEVHPAAAEGKHFQRGVESIIQYLPSTLLTKFRVRRAIDLQPHRRLRRLLPNIRPTIGCAQ